jgi:beta-glucosidase
MNKPTFPPDFLWGASTAAHQVEGGNYNDWTAFEPGHSLAAVAEAEDHYRKHESIWEDFNHDAGKIETYLSNSSTDHYHHFKEDLELAHSLHFTAFRFSVEWSRIEPKEGEFNLEELAHYLDVVHCCKRLGIEPVVTLWHYTLPLWLAKKGGWANSRAAFYFARFTDTVSLEFGDEVWYYITHNEPEIFLTHGYLLGRRPPLKHSLIGYFLAFQQIKRGHIAAYQLLKQRNPLTQIGLAKDCFYAKPSTNSWLNKVVKYLLDHTRNTYLFRTLLPYQDFLGINYYVQFSIEVGLTNPKKWLRDEGPGIAPEGLVPLFQELKQFNKPLLITENGTIDRFDDHRGPYIEKVTTALDQAVYLGIPLIGYLHWSLIDSFEWNKGHLLKFGLIEIDTETGQRRVRPSAKTYAKIIEKHRNASHESTS